MIEQETAGFGASGRNGGWCVGELAAGIDALAAVSDRARALRLVRSMFETVDEVGRVCVAEGIDCGFAKGGTVRVARNGAQLARQRKEVEHHHAAGLSDDDLRVLDRTEAHQRLAATDVVGGVFFARTAALHPAQLVHGLAGAVERRGSPSPRARPPLESLPGRWIPITGGLRAPTIVRATEAYTASLDGETRTLAPLYR